MSGNNMTAAFRLDFTVGSEPLEALRTILSEVNGSLKELARAANPFDEMQQPVARATEGVTGLNEVLSETGAVGAEAAEAVGTIGEAAAGIEAATAAVTGLDDVLGATRGAAAEAAGGMNRIGTEAEEAAERSVSALGRIRTAASALGSGGLGYARNVGGAVRGFGQSIQEGVGSAFGAAATGFGIVMPVRAAAEYDNDLTHIGIGLNLHGADNTRFAATFGRDIDRLARDTGQRGTDLAAAAGYFSREGYTLDQIRAVMPTVARIGTAYNAAPDGVAKTTFAMQENLGISAAEMPGALSAMALAGKSADLPFEKLAPLFPQVAAQAGALGVHGRDGLNDMAAALAVMRKNTGTEGEAVTDMRAFLQTITSSHTAKRFRQYGVDLFGVLKNARASGVDPMMAVLQQVNRITRGGNDLRAVGTLFNNEQDRGFVNALLHHLDGQQGYFAIRKKVGGADPAMVDEDFTTGLESTKIVLQAFEEALSQLERRIGHGFVPILKAATIGLHGLTTRFDWLDQHVPGATTAIIGTVGAMLALATAMGAVGAVAGPLKAGFALFRAVLAPVGALLGGVSLATLGVVAGLAALTVGVVAAALYVSRNLTRISHAFDAGGSGITGALKGTWNVAKMVFNDFTTWLDSWGGGIGTKLHNIVTGLARIFSVPLVAMFQYVRAQFAALDQAFSNSWVGRHVESLMGRGVQPAPAIPAAPPARPAQDGGAAVVHITHDPALKARQTAGPRGAVRITPDRGRMVAQP
ncbi:phage tail tape measure protein [Komagataeibacter sp. FNDCF1]|uniref:phage tail tape measure protein n=1 Tax=Komagataeibacter sp. FNDCF1 TaxID=2878681 RepID=UPI001E544429|nr:phage tail tape measure protein [Komagataeibacter sp. FNDCF1]MCE2563778.1 phage tail tape measure protein [Komagataeibacter sp. FNDCF1]MCE2566164.1 phage tail tape measure protein [Komagataeibacter sp. FNDCF1]